MNEPPAHHDVHILVVEDSSTQAFKLRHLLLKHFSRVTVATNGVEALPLIEADPPAEVIERPSPT